MANITLAPDGALPPGDLIIPELARRADFKIHTAAATIMDERPEGNPLVRAIGSSTILDRGKDTMELSALDSMRQRAKPGMAIFVNHKYQVPEDLVGRLDAAPEVRMSDVIADLGLRIELLTREFDRAMALYKAIKARVQMGVSIGCEILTAEWRDSKGIKVDESNIDLFDVLEGKVFMHILEVDPLEWSFVGIPANQRSWVQYAIQGLFRRALSQGEPDMKLAPLVRAWFPNEYQNDVRALRDKTLRTALQKISPRPHDHRIIVWQPTTKGTEYDFALVERGGHVQTIDRATVAALLAETAPGATDDAAPPQTTGEPSMLIKSVTGKADWPLADRDRAWDGGGAHKRLLEWAGGKDDLDVGKFKSVHFYSPDGDDAQNVSEYKLAFCDVVDGKVQAIPRGIMACTGGHGVDQTTGISAEDKAAIKKKISAYYARMRKEFDDDSLVPSWEKGTEPPMKKMVKGTGGDVEVAEDGSHAAYTGKHSHSHSAFGSQGDDGQHDHEHPHDGDASHDHPHQKATTPRLVKGSGGDIEVNDDGSHAAYNGTHTHSHASYGGDAGAHEHEHPHVNDATHDHPHEKAAPAPAHTAAVMTPPAADTAPSAEQQALLLAYNTLGARLGFPAHTLTTKCNLVADDTDAQKVISVVSALDGLTDQLRDVNITSICYLVDQLMDLMGIPDADEGSMANTASYGTTPSITKAGARNSKSDAAHIQAVHDHACALGANCDGKSASATEAPTMSLDQARDEQDAKATLPTIIKSIETLTAALGGINVAAITAEVQKAHDAAATATKALAAAEAKAATVAQTVEGAEAKLDELMHRPTGRPTQATGTPSRLPEPAPDPTTGLQRKYVDKIGTCIVWPDGHEQGNRPALTDLQRAIMVQMPNGKANLAAYEAGEEALVPVA